jgi:amyloid beta precursor protein binding protein 1
VIGATATSTSTLKNLVLPGIGHFTILDPNDVAVEDVGNNFFLEVESIGRPKAVETSRWLSELNDGVDSAAEVNVRFRFRGILWAKSPTNLDWI